MNLIVAVDQEWGIGYKGNLLEKISEDMKFFKEKTVGKTVIMGRVTFETLPNKKPLKDRNNIVLSTKNDILIDGVKICKDLDELFNQLKNIDTSDIFVIGGERIYKLLLSYCKKAYITKIYQKYDSDAKMTNLDKLTNWKITENSEILTNNKGISFQFFTYENDDSKTF